MFFLAGTSDLNRGVVFAQLLFEGETVELFDSGEPPSFGGTPFLAILGNHALEWRAHASAPTLGPALY